MKIITPADITIQLEFDHYVRTLKKELVKGEKRAAARGYAPPLSDRVLEAA
jgi:hypothetical protein